MKKTDMFVENRSITTELISYNMPSDIAASGVPSKKWLIVSRTASVFEMLIVFAEYVPFGYDGI